MQKRETKGMARRPGLLDPKPCNPAVGAGWRRAALGAFLFCVLLGAVAYPARAIAEGVRADATACPDQQPFRVAIDIGHSPQRHGATSARGKGEYAFNSRFARELVERSRAVAKLNLFLLDPDARRSGLRERPAHAREAGADAFLSIHHDYVNDRYLQTWTVDGKQRRYSDVYRGHSLFVSEANGEAEASVALAQAVGQSLAAQGLKPTLHHAEKIPGEGRLLLDEKLGIYEAPFAVLRYNALPAVLLEVGVIAHRDEELLLEDAAYRARVQDAVIAGLVDFCRQRPAATGGHAGSAERR